MISTRWWRARVPRASAPSSSPAPRRSRAGTPLFLHSRDAHPRFAQIVRTHGVKQAVAHCFTGEAEELHAYLDLGLYVGITGWISDERRGTHVLRLVQDIPADRLLLETDSP